MVRDSAARRQSYRLGAWSETLAVGLLRLKGYRILARRWVSGAGEIDIVARRGRRLAFVEVKHRSTDEAFDIAIPPRQRRRILIAADVWIARHPADARLERGFDAIYVAPGRLPRHRGNVL